MLYLTLSMQIPEEASRGTLDVAVKTSSGCGSHELGCRQRRSGGMEFLPATTGETAEQSHNVNAIMIFFSSSLKRDILEHFRRVSARDFYSLEKRRTIQT
ncbi:hypothetical protein KSP39_PZI010389 [Platanthera zijinensis]|uniref:Uncharacterized protein n=1 Tax=Platanthera zijinensis TaxID=2320716 RepID=A0AAP0BJ81_9ASPA